MTGQTGQAIAFDDPADARRFVLQGLWLTRLAGPEELPAALRLVTQTAAEGVSGWPTGAVADLCAVLRSDAAVIRRAEPLPGVPPALLRHYEDYVLGRLTNDATIERCVSALARCTPAEAPRGLLFVLRRLTARLGLPTVELSPALVREIAREKPADLLQEGYATLAAAGPLPLLVQMLEAMVAAFRRSADLLGIDDAVALETRTALGDLAQYVAHRQLEQLAAHFETTLPLKPRLRAARREVATSITDDDHYPVGGYASIGTKGSIESMLHSQLAYMERDESPDLFDIKFVRDELFYYTRDENQFLRQRRRFDFHFAADLASARFKDPSLPAQRLVLAQSVVLAAIRKLGVWLSHEALHFAVSFDPALAPEQELFEIVLHNERRRGSATVRTAEHASPGSLVVAVASAAPMALVVGERPTLVMDGHPLAVEGEGLEAWSGTLAAWLAAVI